MAGLSFQRWSVCCQVSNRIWVYVYTLHSSESQEATQCYTTYSALHSLETNKISFCEAMYKGSCSDCSQITLPKVSVFLFFTGFASRPCFYVHETPPEEPTSAQDCSPLTHGSRVSQAREWESSLITDCTCKSTVLHSAETGLLPRAKGWLHLFCLR